MLGDVIGVLVILDAKDNDPFWGYRNVAVSTLISLHECNSTFFIGFSDEVVLRGFIQMRCSCSDNCFFDLTLVD